MKNKHIETCEADDLDLSRAIEFAKELGRRGGLATLKKRGKAHYKKMNEASQRAYKLKKAKLKPPIIVTKKSPNNLTQYNLTQLTGMKSGSKDRYRELVRIRDNYTCQNCGKKWEKGMRRFDVHHLDEERESAENNPKLKNTVCKWDREHMDRMITYCHKCHLNLDSVRKKMRGKRE